MTLKTLISDLRRGKCPLGNLNHGQALADALERIEQMEQQLKALNERTAGLLQAGSP